MAHEFESGAHFGAQTAKNPRKRSLAFLRAGLVTITLRLNDNGQRPTTASPIIYNVLGVRSAAFPPRVDNNKPISIL
jgi:hypothetical protein